MPIRHKKNRSNSHAERQSSKKDDYAVIMTSPLPFLTLPLPPQEWSKPGDYFAKFTLYDESQISYTSSSTNYVEE